MILNELKPTENKRNSLGKNAYFDQKWFDTLHLKENLKGHSIKGGFNTIGGQAISFLLNIGSNILIARLLAPADFGLVAMVTAITGFITIFSDLGLSAAVIQRDNIKQDQVSAIFWINVLISFGIALIVSAIATVLVHFYNEPRLFNITIVFAIGIFFSGLSLQHNALLKRQMKFKNLSLIQIVSTAVSLSVGLLLAWRGYGYWAIVATNVISPIFSTILLWIVCDWRPNFITKANDVGAFLKFGAGMTGFDLVNYFSRNMDNILIGKYVGSIALGLYSKAYQLLMLPITQLRNPLNAVALPALSTLQNEKDKYVSFYKKYLFTLSFFSMPIVIFLGVFSDEIILIILGKQWVAASYIFKLLAITAFIQPVASTQGLVLITTGKVKKYFKVGVINAIFTVSGFFIGVHWGVEGVAISQAIVIYLLLIPMLYYCFIDSHLSVGIFLSEIFYPVLFSAISGCVMAYTKQTLSQHYSLPGIILIAIGFITGLLTYIVLWLSMQKSRSRFFHILEIGSFLKRK